jgi:hypothetical protein
MFEVPGSDITSVILTEDVVKGKTGPGYERSPKNTNDEEPSDEDSGYEEEQRVRQN